ncbi:MAG: hypothetical protein JRD89_01255 [Deltaproteobacteria bacterium]|nr:hypothetical protein [Deltaproteobacteria bacterium]
MTERDPLMGLDTQIRITELLIEIDRLQRSLEAVKKVLGEAEEEVRRLIRDAEKRVKRYGEIGPAWLKNHAEGQLAVLRYTEGQLRKLRAAVEGAAEEVGESG